MSQGIGIKITTFKQLSFQKPNQTIPPPRGQYLFNVIAYSPAKTLKFLDPCFRQFNSQGTQVFVVKCNNISNLAYSLKSCKVGIKTILIIDEKIDKQTIYKIMSNQQIMKNKDNFICWIYTKEVESVESIWFHAAPIGLITSDKQKMIEMLKGQFQKIRSKLSSYNSSTTIQSSDKINMDIKLQIAQGQNKTILGEDNFFSKNYSDQVLDNGVPPVGKYSPQKDTWLEKGMHFGKSK